MFVCSVESNYQEVLFRLEPVNLAKNTQGIRRNVRKNSKIRRANKTSRKIFFFSVLSQRSKAESSWEIETQTFEFRTPMPWHLATETYRKQGAL